MTDDLTRNDPLSGLPLDNDLPSREAVQVEEKPLPDTAPDPGSNINDAPPVRLGQGAVLDRKPVEAAGSDNPVHHEGRLPPPVTGTE